MVEGELEKEDYDTLISCLHREATKLKDAGDWDKAIVKLKEAQTYMLKAKSTYPVQTWCRLAKFLQYGGYYEESLREFDFLLRDLRRVLMNNLRFDNPNIQFTAPKKDLLRASLIAHRAEIQREMKAVIAREARQQARLKK